MADWQKLAAFSGPIVMIGFGSIGKGTLPLIQRHIDSDLKRLTVIAPDAEDRALAEQTGATFMQLALTRDNLREVLTPLLTGGEPGFIVNLSVDVSSVALIELAWELGALYIDTCIEPWPGAYTDPGKPMSARTNYMLRESALALKAHGTDKPTAVVAHGANPGLVNHFVKEALLHLARDTGHDTAVPTDRAGWGRLAQALGVKGIHIAERDTQVPGRPKTVDEFMNTWSIAGFISEGMQPAELGWGTHEKALPHDGGTHEVGCGAAIFLKRPGCTTRVRTWTPNEGPFHGWLITHNESISIADFFTVREGDAVVYRPTCHYAYHPCDGAVLSLHEFAGKNFQLQGTVTLIDPEIVSGMDELGVLLYGHGKNAYWYGSQLSIEEARSLAPYQNATGLQVTSAVLAGMVWAIENPRLGLCDTDELDHARVLEIAKPYLGRMHGEYTDWTPLEGRDEVLFPDDIDREDPWQFRNVVVR